MSKQQTYTDKELLHGNGKRYINLFPENVIGDFNVEGYENVTSEDFDYPFGGVGKPKKYAEPVLPPVIDRRTAEQIRIDKDNLKYFFMTDEEKQAREDEYLKSKGIL